MIYGMAGIVVPNAPVQAPPVHPDVWSRYQKCLACEVAWYSDDPRCWICGQVDATKEGMMNVRA